jgi:hypothetical protein
MSIEKFSDLIRNRPRDLPACSVVPQPTTPPRAPSVFRHYLQNICTVAIFVIIYFQNILHNVMWSNGVSTKVSEFTCVIRALHHHHLEIEIKKCFFHIRHVVLKLCYERTFSECSYFWLYVTTRHFMICRECRSCSLRLRVSRDCHVCSYWL